MSAQNLRALVLPIAIVLGVVAHTWISKLFVLTPYLLSLILILTFSKMSPKELRFSKPQFLILAIQLIGAVSIYFAIAPYNYILAQGAMICVLTPTATSAPAITRLLDGNLPFITSYIFLSNMVVALFAPLFFSAISTSDTPFFVSFVTIISRVAALLIIPLAIIWGLRYLAPKIHDAVASVSHYSFYVWAVSLTIVTSNTINYIAENSSDNYHNEILVLIVSFFIAILQFYFGKRLGRKYGDPVTYGQTLGQKNTILAIWMAQTFLNPLSSIAPAGYVFWQNLINSYQMWQKERNRAK